MIKVLLNVGENLGKSSLVREYLSERDSYPVFLLPAPA